MHLSTKTRDVVVSTPLDPYHGSRYTYLSQSGSILALPGAGVWSAAAVTSSQSLGLQVYFTLYELGSN